jgi:hypothetical protein
MLIDTDAVLREVGRIRREAAIARRVDRQTASQPQEAAGDRRSIVLQVSGVELCDEGILIRLK